MHPTPDNSDPTLDRFTEWLKTTSVSARPDLAARIRLRMQQDANPADATLDSLFKQDASLYNPRLIWQVRGRLRQEPVRPAKTSWPAWLAPIAAAAMLGLAFMSFQTTAPRIAQDQEMVLGQPEATELVLDPELTQIFALASNLNGKANMSRMQSLDDLASLFD